MSSKSSVDRVARVRIELKHADPKIWRRVDVPVTYTLEALHDVIHAAFEWSGWHLFEFSIGDNRYSGPDILDRGLDEEDPTNVTLEDVIRSGVKRFHYVWDFGDYWDHIVTIIRVLDAKPGVEYPALQAGRSLAPEDDVGGLPGFYYIAEIADDPDHPQREDYEEMFGKSYMDDFDLDRFDKEEVRDRLVRLGRRLASEETDRSA